MLLIQETKARAMITNARFRVAKLPQNRPTQFDIRADGAVLAALADQLGVTGLRKLRFQGDIRAMGKSDWRLTGQLGATVVQPCVVTLHPVTTRIDTEVSRQFLLDMPDPTWDEVEMPKDDSQEPLGDIIDISAVMVEALVLALPEFPRRDGVELGEAVYIEPGRIAIQDEDTRPFAQLSGLRDALTRKK